MTLILRLFSNCELTVICKALFAVKHPFLIKNKMLCDNEMWLLLGKDVGKKFVGHMTFSGLEKLTIVLAVA